MIASRPIFIEKGFEKSDPKNWKNMSDLSDIFEKKSQDKESDLLDSNGKDKESNKLDSLSRAMRRAKAAVRELALANKFEYFVTLTLNKEKVDRYNMDEITKKLNNWLDNQVRRSGLAYVLVPERHKDGAIHFHGFFNGALRAVDSGRKDKNGHTIFNLPQWRLGFTTAIRLYGDYHSAVGYVCKYIGKQGEKPGGRWYYSGGALARPEIILAEAMEVDAPAGAHRFCIEDANLWITMWTERGNGHECAGQYFSMGCAGVCSCGEEGLGQDQAGRDARLCRETLGAGDGHLGPDWSGDGDSPF